MINKLSRLLLIVMLLQTGAIVAAGDNAGEGVELPSFKEMWDQESTAFKHGVVAGGVGCLGLALIGVSGYKPIATKYMLPLILITNGAYLWSAMAMSVNYLQKPKAEKLKEDRNFTVLYGVAVLAFVGYWRPYWNYLLLGKK